MDLRGPTRFVRFVALATGIAIAGPPAAPDASGRVLAPKSAGGKIERSAHYRIWSNAPPIQVRQALDHAEILHAGWSAWVAGKGRHGVRHDLRLFATRLEMRQALPGLGWAEGIYHDGICDQYVDRRSEYPWTWLLHEATHQVAAEDASVHLPRWANEGLACLFGVSRIEKGLLRLGSVDSRTYPTWWLVGKPLSGSLAMDTVERLVPPGRFLHEPEAVDISASVNAHYLGWWTFVHYLHVQDSVKFRDWVLHDGTYAGLARRYDLGPSLNRRWYGHVLALADSVRRR